jgi:hypothetical protein
VDPVHHAMDIFYEIVFRKIIPLNPENCWSLRFLQLTP